MALVPWGEWRPDVSDFRGEHSKTIENVLPRGDGYGPIAALTAFTGALGAACRGAFASYDDDGTVLVFAGTATKLYKLSNTDLTWSDVSKAATTYAVATNDQWQFCQMGLTVIAVNQNDNVQFWTLGTSTTFDNLAGSPPKAAYATVIGEHVVLSGLLSNPYDIAWSARSDPTGWTAGTNGSDTQTFADGGLVRSISGSEFDGLIFQDTAIRRMVFVGGALVFEISRIVSDKGLRAPYSMVRAANRTFFLSATGFEEIISGGLPTPIGRERFDETIRDEIDFGSPKLILGVADPRSTRVFWFYKSSTGAAGIFDKGIVWDWALQRGAHITGVTGEYVITLSQPGLTMESLDSVSASIDALTTSLDDINPVVSQALAFFDTSHKLALQSGTNLEATLDTADLVQEQRVFVRGFRPVTDAGTVFGRVEGRQKSADAIALTPETAMNTVGSVPQRIDTRHTRFRTRIPAEVSWTYSVGVEPDMVVTGKR